MANLENVSTEDLRQILVEVDDGAAVQRLMTAITYKEINDLTQKAAAGLYGFSESWASKWFNRLERLETEPFDDVICDEPQSGRPSELSDQEHERFVDVLHEPPEEAGIDAPAWSVPLARHYLIEEFGVEYCERHVRRLMHKVGVSPKRPRPEPASADEKEREEFEETVEKRPP